MTASATIDRDNRPVRAALPFRVIRGEMRGVPIVELEYDADIHTVAGVKRLPFKVMCGPPNPDPRMHMEPLAGAILRLMEMYHLLEQQHDTAAKERDEALARCVSAESALEKAEQRLDELKRRTSKGDRT